MVSGYLSGCYSTDRNILQLRLLHCRCYSFISDFRYQQHVNANNKANSVSGSDQEASFAFPGGTHAGFTSLADALWRGGLGALLDGSVKGDVTHVSVAGHSLGAGVATLLSYRMQVRLSPPQGAAGQQVV